MGLYDGCTEVGLEKVALGCLHRVTRGCTRLQRVALGCIRLQNGYMRSGCMELHMVAKGYTCDVPRLWSLLGYKSMGR